MPPVKICRSILAAAAVLATALAVPQEATPEQIGRWPVNDPKFAGVHFETKLGSFRSINGTGRFEVSFEGTILVAELKKGGTMSVSGNLHKEYEGMDRVVYTGQGKLIVDGEWRAIQWYGKNMKGYWYGHGSMRCVGEFDENLNTGTFWYTDPASKVTWYATQTLEMFLPSRQMNQGAVKPVRKPMSDY